MALQLTLNNWLCHKRLELDFESPVNLVVSSNMAGKTAIRDAIEFVTAGTGLFRGIATKKDLAMFSIYEDEPGCDVELTLVEDTGEIVLHLRRTMNRTGVQTVLVGGSDGDIELKKLGDAQALIWKRLGISELQLRALLASEFLFLLAPNDRRSLVASVLGDMAIDKEELTDQFSRRGFDPGDTVEFSNLVMSSGWRIAQETAERRRADSKAAIKSMGEKPAPVEILTPPWRKEPINLRLFTVGDVEERLAGYRDVKAKSETSLASNRGAIEERLRGFEARTTEAEARLTERNAAGPLVVDARTSDLKLAKDALDTEVRARDALDEEITKLVTTIEIITSEGIAIPLQRPDPCPVIQGNPKCPMTPKKLEDHRLKLLAQQPSIEEALDSGKSRRGQLVALIQQKQAVVDNASQRLDAERARSSELAGLASTLSNLEGEIERASTELADAQSGPDVGDGKFIDERIEQGEKMLAAKQAFDRDVEGAAGYDDKLKQHEAARDRYDLIAQALKPDAVEAVFADRVLAPMRESIESFGKRFGGMRLDSEFNVEWKWKGEWRRYQQLSESGRLRIGYAVQATFARLCKFPLLVVDQIDHLDAEGKFALIETLRDWSPEFKSVIGLATLQRPEPAPAPFENVQTWHLDDGELRRVK